MSRISLLILALGALALGAWAAPARTGTVLLTLAEGVAAASPGDRGTRDMELELTLRDGAFEKTVYGYAAAFNRADHDGELVAVEGNTLTVHLVLNKDRWYPATPGAADYRVTLRRDGDTYTGTFTGTFRYPDAGGEVKRDVKGTVTGQVSPLWTDPPQGFQALAPNEHPRLIFRKSDLPMLRKRMETPEGRAIMARMMEVLPKQIASHGKTEPYFPAGYAVAYQLTGDKTYADKAKELLAGMFDLRGSQDIHYGPMAQAMAVTLDCCYDAWDAEFRQKVIDNLAKRVRDLYTITGMGGASMAPWHNHEGVRAGSGGVAAICLLGEKTSDGKEIPNLDRMVREFARSIRRYFQYAGTSNTGFCLEGRGYKRMTWNSGPGNLIQAYRTALGGDLMAGEPGAWAILGEWMQQPPSDRVVSPESLGDDQYSGLFIMGMTTVPDSMKAGTRWLFDHAYGLEGNKTFGLLWAYHAGYLLMNYPFDVKPAPPAVSLPWAAPDPVGGRWLFRKPWQSGQDTLAVFHLRSSIRGTCHNERSGRTWDMQLFALGKQWIGDRDLREDGGVGAALPTTTNAGALNDKLGAQPTWWQTTDDGKAVLSLDMSDIYLQPLAGGAAPQAGQQVVRNLRIGSYIDQGIRARRDVALDFSGACGAPVLFVIADRFEGAKDVTWTLKLAADAGTGKVDGNTVIAGDPAGANLRCTFIAAQPLALTGAITAKGATEYFAVITVQNGPAPAMKVEGQGLAATVTVGGQTIRLADGKLVLAK